jgi:protein AroM
LTGTTSPRPVGVVTIGQTPRDDLTPELALHLPGVQLVERGALDGLTADEIASLAPGPDEVPVITRLAGGGSVTVSHGRITSLLRRALEDLVADGVPSTILACTGELPEIDVSGVLRPGTLMRRALAGYAECGYRVGVVCPLAEQIEVVERSWYDARIPVQVAAADPLRRGSGQPGGRSRARRGRRCNAGRPRLNRLHRTRPAHRPRGLRRAGHVGPQPDCQAGRRARRLDGQRRDGSPYGARLLDLASAG